MPQRAPTPCRKPGCSGRCYDRSGYCSEHQSLRSNWNRNQNTTRRGYGAAWRKLREQILQRDKYVCQPCLKRGVLTALMVGNPKHPRAAEVDHIVSKENGGTDDPSNLQAICRKCHGQKTARERVA